MRSTLNSLILLALAAFSLSAQQVYPVNYYTVANITANGTVIDNRSASTRMADYHGFCALGSGTWSATIQYSDTSSTGPWNAFAFGRLAVTNSSSACYGYATGYHPYIRFLITGTSSVNYVGNKGFWFPVSPSYPDITAASPLVYDGTTGNLSIPAATNSVSGYLTSTDWGTFNSKENALTFSAPLARASNTVSLPVATSSVSGYLLNTDWITFNAKMTYPSGGSDGNCLVRSGSGTTSTWSSCATGSVTSVGLALPTEFSISGSPVTGSGTLTGAWASQLQNLVLASPSGSSGTPAFRALTALDIPNLAASIITSGQLTLARGGTGADMSATGGTGQFVKQSTVGGNFSASVIANSDLPSAFDLSAKTSTNPWKTGLVSAIPATCAVGDAYFATDGTPSRKLYLCTATNTWIQSAYIQGASNPGTCTIGQINFRTDASAGQNLYFCTASNTWTQMTGGGGGGLGDPGSNGIVIRTALNTTTARTLTCGTGITCSNADGTAGNPGVTTDFTEVMRNSTAQAGTPWSAISTTGNDTYAAVLSPILTSYTTNACYVLYPDATNSGTATLELVSGSPKNILTRTGGALTSGDILLSKPNIICYDGTQFLLQGGGTPVTPSTPFIQISGINYLTGANMMTVTALAATGSWTQVGSPTSFAVDANGSALLVATAASTPGGTLQHAYMAVGTNRTFDFKVYQFGQSQSAADAGCFVGIRNAPTGILGGWLITRGGNSDVNNGRLNVAKRNSGGSSAYYSVLYEGINPSDPPILRITVGANIAFLVSFDGGYSFLPTSINAAYTSANFDFTGSASNSDGIVVGGTGNGTNNTSCQYFVREQ